MPAAPQISNNWLKQLNSTVLPDILPGVMFFTLASVIITVACKETGYEMKVNTVMLTVLGTMISFVISLRTSTANDRYNEGRRAWSAITLASRNFALNIWLHLPATSLPAGAVSKLTPDELELEKAKSLLEKRTMINLVHAFSVAAKHYLRDESGPYYEDLYYLVQALPKYDFPSSVSDNTGRRSVLGLWRTPGAPDGKTYIPATSNRRRRYGTADSSNSGESANEYGVQTQEPDLEKGAPTHETIFLAPGYAPPAKTAYDYVPPLLVFRPIVNLFSRHHQVKSKATQRKEAVKRIPETNIPLQITMFLSGYISTVIGRGTMPPPLISVMLGPVQSLQDSITTLERVLTTPLPFAYQAHLRLSIYVYLIFLPFQTYALLGYLSIVASAVAATIFLGFFELGAQLENPFGFDDSDLPLDHYCDLIGMELREIVSHPQPDPMTYVFSPDNCIFAPGDARTAQELLDEASQKPGGVERNLRNMFTDHFCSGGEIDEKNWKKHNKNKSMASIEVLTINELQMR